MTDRGLRTPIAGKCALIVDGRSVDDVAHVIEVDNGEECQVYGFLSAAFDALKAAQMAKRVQVELGDGRVLEVRLLQVNRTGIALITINEEAGPRT